VVWCHGYPCQYAKCDQHGHSGYNVAVPGQNSFALWWIGLEGLLSHSGKISELQLCLVCSG
jgi:hypothetical protein